MLGAFVKGFAFSPDIDPGHAHHLLRVAEGLTYRQMVLLNLVHTRRLSSLGPNLYFDQLLGAVERIAPERRDCAAGLMFELDGLLRKRVIMSFNGTCQ